MVSFS